MKKVLETAPEAQRISENIFDRPLRRARGGDQSDITKPLQRENRS